MEETTDSGDLWLITYKCECTILLKDGKKSITTKREMVKENEIGRKQVDLAIASGNSFSDFLIRKVKEIRMENDNKEFKKMAFLEPEEGKDINTHIEVDFLVKIPQN